MMTNATASSESIELQLSSIQKSLDKMTSVLDQFPAMISMAADTIDSKIIEGRESGIDIEERLSAGLQLLMRLSEPKLNKSLNSALDLLEQSPDLITIVTDTIDEKLSMANSIGTPLAERADGVLQLLDRLTDKTQIEKIDHLLNLADQVPGMTAIVIDTMDEAMSKYGPQLEVLGHAMEAAQKAASQPRTEMGFFGLLGMLWDKDVKKVLGFAKRFFKEFGQKL